MLKTRIAVLVSGGGTNLQALLDAQDRGEIPCGEIVLVVSDKEDAYALERAKNHGVETAVLSRRKKADRAAFEDRLSETLAAHGIEMIILAGFMVILSEKFVKQYPRRILNVHPSLIPSFCGAGYYGLRVHEAAIRATPSMIIWCRAAASRRRCPPAASSRTRPTTPPASAALCS